jgi:hypothetical protein
VNTPLIEPMIDKSMIEPTIDKPPTDGTTAGGRRPPSTAGFSVGPYPAVG